MYFYAQLDENNIVIEISQVYSQIDAPNMILLDSLDHIVLGKKYNHETGEFENVPQLDPESEPPTEQEIINAELFLGQAQIAETLIAIDETIAVILLEVIGGEA